LIGVSDAMGIMLQISLIFFAGLVLLCLGFIRKNKALKAVGGVLSVLAVMAMLLLFLVLLPRM